MDQLINQVLHDRYRLQSLLGRQTGRRTFLAIDLQTELPVVLKLLLFGPDFEWADLKLFEREAEVLKSLDHPAIPHYLAGFEVETELGKGFALVQTYLEAKTLQAWIQSGRTFSEAELKTIAQELLGVLDYLHQRQPAVVHRDLKPSNILLGDRSGNSPGQVYLVDFGSVQTAAHEGTRTIVGTYGYMPPEQFGGQTSPASDLYALGATLIYLATGQPPDQLPQREMRILFADRVNLSPSFINWLKSLTEPSLDLRLRSTKQALAQLGNPDSGESHLTVIPKPDGSRVKITKSSEAFEIFIPPSGFKMWVIPVILFEIGWNAYILAVLIVLIIDSITKLYFGGYLVALAYSPIVLMISYVPTVAVLSTLCFRTRLRITQSEISKRSANGLQTKTLCAAITPQTVVKLHQETSAFPRWKKEERKTGKVSRLIIRLDIFVGSKVISMGVMEGNDALTRSELYWLAQELSSWLNLPIT